MIDITDETYLIPLELKIEGFGIIRLTLGKNSFRHNMEHVLKLVRVNVQVTS